ncbi:hypothetical protein F5Y15DRAFT_289171 [Xylariaceae sp. FL0016]|nr:hypothetical protein F5Y15DRAFT_289171 [Xylariaceae sp. FL0016]
MFLLSCVWLLLVAIRHATGDGFEDPFTRNWVDGGPKDYSDNQNYNIGTIIQFGWAPSVVNGSLSLCQDNYLGYARGGPCSAPFKDPLDGSFYTWKVSYVGLDPDYNNVYFFSLDEGPDGDGSFLSQWFNISGSETTASTTSSLSTSSTSSPAQSSNAQASSTQPLAAPTVTITNSAGIQGGTLAGIVVGITAGLGLLFGGLWWVCVMRKHRDAQAVQDGQGTVTGSNTQFYQDIHGTYNEAYGNPVCEVAGCSRPQLFEAGGREVRKTGDAGFQAR